MTTSYRRVVFTAWLAACGRSERSDTPATQPAQNNSGTWSLSARGLGPLVAGMTATAAASATAGALVLPAADSTAPCQYATWTSAPVGASVMFEQGTLARVDITEAGVRTAEGLQVGDAATRADSMYGSVAERRPHKYEAGEYLIVRPLAPADTMHRLVIEVVDGRVKRLRSGRYPAVEYVEGCA